MQRNWLIITIQVCVLFLELLPTLYIARKLEFTEKYLIEIYWIRK